MTYLDWIAEVSILLALCTDQTVESLAALGFDWKECFDEGQTPDEALVSLAEWTCDDTLYAELDEYL